MDDIFPVVVIFLCVSAFVIGVWGLAKSDILKHENPTIIPPKKIPVEPAEQIGKKEMSSPGFLSFSDFWSYKEMRFMVAACVIIAFFSFITGGKIELKVTHDISKLSTSPIKGDIKINHDFGGNLHHPITVQLSDPGYPVKVEVRNR